jgi:UDPglucose 6-dehydrogenase
VELPLVEATLKVNRGQPYRVVELAGELIGDFRGRRISVLGLAFKPGTDDVRDAVSIRIVRRLVEEGAKVVVYDPKAMDNAKKIFGENVEYASSVEECLKGSECALLYVFGKSIIIYVLIPFIARRFRGCCSQHR